MAREDDVARRRAHRWTPTRAAALISGPPRLRLTPLRSALGPQRGSNSRCGIVTRAAGEGPRYAGIDGQCESRREQLARGPTQWGSTAIVSRRTRPTG